MKKTIIIISTLILIFGLSLTACSKTPTHTDFSEYSEKVEYSTKTEKFDFCKIVSEIVGFPITSNKNAPYYFTISADGYFCIIDTCPSDILTSNSFSSSNPAFDYIKTMNKKLNLPDSLYTTMMNTAPAQGQQFLIYDKITVIYSFDYEKGLEVQYMYTE